MKVDIPELDDTANHLKVSWKKANNYFHHFAREYLKVKAEFDSGRYGSDSLIFDWWLAKKVGYYPKFIEKRIRLHCHGLASAEREKLEREERQRFAAERQEKAQRRQQREAEKASTAATRDTMEPEMREESEWEMAMRKEALEIAAMRPRRAQPATRI